MRYIYHTCGRTNVCQAGSWIHSLSEQEQPEKAGSSSHWLYGRFSGFSVLMTLLLVWWPSEGDPLCLWRELVGRKCLLPGWDGHSSAFRPWLHPHGAFCRRRMGAGAHADVPGIADAADHGLGGLPDAGLYLFVHQKICPVTHHYRPQWDQAWVIIGISSFQRNEGQSQ